MQACPVCNKSGFTNISIKTHVEVCLQRSDRAAAAAAAVKKQDYTRSISSPTPPTSTHKHSSSSSSALRLPKRKIVPEITPISKKQAASQREYQPTRVTTAVNSTSTHGIAMLDSQSNAATTTTTSTNTSTKASHSPSIYESISFEV
jgi:hypothetical protein